MVLLRVDGVEFSYGSTNVLRGVRLEVNSGEVVSIVGPNGSGKTTLLRVIDGILKPRRGSVYVDGGVVHKLSRRDVAKLFGYVPQRLGSIQPMTVIDFVVSGRRAYITFMPTREDYEKSLKALKELGLGDKAYRRVTELSGGEFQMVLIARALVADPRVLLLDEPTANLDPRHQIEIMNLIGRISKSRGIAVLTALHDLTLAYRYSDKVIMMRDGEVFSAGSPDEVLNPENIYKVYGVRALIIPNLKSIVFLDT